MFWCVKKYCSFIMVDVEILLRSPDSISNNCYCSKKSAIIYFFGKVCLPKAYSSSHSDALLDLSRDVEAGFPRRYGCTSSCQETP